MAKIHLRTLDLSNQTQSTIEDADVESSLKMQPNGFQYLNVRGCKELTDRAATHIVSHPTLEYLNVSDTNLTDGFLATLANSDLNITHLKMMKCPQITPQGVLDFTTKIAPKHVDIKMDTALCRQVLELAQPTKPS